jgi:UDP-glucose 4-epimerase
MAKDKSSANRVAHRCADVDRVILVTGGSGFIGLHLTRALLESGADVLSTRYRANRERIAPEHGGRLTEEPLDVADVAAVQAIFARYPIERVIHLAAPGMAALDADGEYRANMLSLLNILEASRAAGVQRVIVASGVAVYAGISNGPYTEDMPLPVKSHGTTPAFKKASETLGIAYSQRTGLDVVYARVAFIYGPLYHSMANAPSKLVHAAVRGGAEALPVVFDVQETFDFCYVTDCSAGLALLDAAPALEHRIYNIGSGCATTHRELADVTAQVVPGSAVRASFPQAEHARTSPYMSIARIESELGYRPAFSIAAGVRAYAEWLRSHDR